MLGKYMPKNDLIAFLWLLAIIMITVTLGKMLTLVNQCILRTKLFVRLDKKF